MMVGNLGLHWFSEHEFHISCSTSKRLIIRQVLVIGGHETRRKSLQDSGIPVAKLHPFLYEYQSKASFHFS